MARCLLILFFVSSIASGCLVREELVDGVWEVNAQIIDAQLSVNEDNTAVLDFTLIYLLGLVDDQGIEEVTWTYALLDSNRNVVNSSTGRMRDPEPDLREVYVQGERPRNLEFDAGQIDSDKIYVLSAGVVYRDTLLGEVLVPVSVAQPYQAEANLGEIPIFAQR